MAERSQVGYWVLAHDIVWYYAHLALSWWIDNFTGRLCVVSQKAKSVDHLHCNIGSEIMITLITLEIREEDSNLVWRTSHCLDNLMRRIVYGQLKYAEHLLYWSRVRITIWLHIFLNPNINAQLITTYTETIGHIQSIKKVLTRISDILVNFF